MFTMSVYDNLAFGLKSEKFPKEEIPKKLNEALQAVRLSGFEKRRARKNSPAANNKESL